MANQANTAAYRGNDGKMWVNVDSNKTLAAVDQGYTQNVIADGVVVTLPSTAAGLKFRVRNGGVAATGGPVGTGSAGTALIAVSPASADAISGANFTAATNKDALNTKATSKVGDFIELYGSGTAGATAWNVHDFAGTWAREA